MTEYTNLTDLKEKTNELLQEKLKRLDYKIEKNKREKMEIEKEIDDRDNVIKNKKYEIDCLYDVERDWTNPEEFEISELKESLSLDLKILDDLKNNLMNLEDKLDNYRKQKQELEQKQMQQDLDLGHMIHELQTLNNLPIMQNCKYFLQFLEQKQIQQDLDLRQTTYELQKLKKLAIMRGCKYFLRSELKKNRDSLRNVRSDHNKLSDENAYDSLSHIMMNYNQCRELKQIIKDTVKALQKKNEDILKLKKENYVA